MVPWRESHHLGVDLTHWFTPCLLQNASMNLTDDQPRAVRFHGFITSIATSNSYMLVTCSLCMNQGSTLSSPCITHIVNSDDRWHSKGK